jgi:hypothetical protein
MCVPARTLRPRVGSIILICCRIESILLDYKLPQMKNELTQVIIGRSGQRPVQYFFHILDLKH